MTQMAERLFDVPHPENEALLSSDVSLEIIGVEQSEAENVSNLGAVTHEVVHFNDGSTYQHMFFEPHIPKSNAPLVTNTTAWCTSMNGYNKKVATLLMGEGLTVDMIAPPDVGFSDIPHLYDAIHLDHDIQAHQKILDLGDERKLYDASRIVISGASRGGQIGMGLHASAADHDREVVYFDYIDPCLEHKLSAQELRPDRLVRYGARELINAVATIVTNLTARDVIDSFPLTPKAVLQDVAVGCSLFSTESGRHARAIPLNAIGHITLFTGSELNHRAQWHEIFDPMPYVTLDEPRGYHINIAEKQHTVASVLRVGRAAWLASEGADVRDFDLSLPVK